jgi:membrane protease YdiL (CAAX protease family)
VSKRLLPEFLDVPWGIKEVIVFIVAWFGLQLVLGILLAALSHYIPAVATFLRSAQSNNVGASFALDLAGVVIGLCIVALYLRHFGVTWQAVGWRKVGVLRALQYLFGILIVFFIAANLALLLVKVLIPGFDANQAQTNDFTTATQTHRSLALIALVLLPPIFEETIFRGFLFPALAKRTGAIWGAVISSAIFGAAHGQANLFVYTFVLGMLLCFMYYRLRSIVPGILLHMLNNYLAFLAISGK